MVHIPVREFVWTEDYSFMRELTCKNHSTAQYATKNPFTRGLHLLKSPEGYPVGAECSCPFDDQVVVTEEGTCTN